MSRAFNFGAGPAALPKSVLEIAQAELLDYQSSGMSIMESSHRGKEYSAVHEEAIANLRTLLGLSDDFAVLFLQGGASSQFAMLPMNLLPEGRVADYTSTGAWASKAIKEARQIGEVHIAADSTEAQPARMPLPEELNFTQGAAYVHVTSNETIEGTQWKAFPDTEAPLVADMSSDILSRPLNMEQFGFIYAGAQKNLGPAGVTLAVIRKSLIEQARTDLPTMLRYKTHADKDSLYNTPPTFPIYIVMLVTRWLIEKGGLAAMAAFNEDKAGRLYTAIDNSEFYRGTADPAHRSLMNVTFRLPNEELEATFVKEAAEQRMKGLKGHRSVGGIRASIYNACPMEGVDALVAFMKDFESRNG